MNIESIKREIIEKFKKTKILILDVDGVMTNGSIILGSNDNEEYKQFNVRDGTGIKMFQRAGLQVALITGRKSGVVERRAAELAIKDVHQGAIDKFKSFNQILKKHNIDKSESVFIGDDIIDIPVLKEAGVGVAVNDAIEQVIDASDLVTKNKGGNGAVREITDLILKIQGKYEDVADYNYSIYSKKKSIPDNS